MNHRFAFPSRVLVGCVICVCALSAGCDVFSFTCSCPNVPEPSEGETFGEASLEFADGSGPNARQGTFDVDQDEVRVEVQDADGRRFRVTYQKRGYATGFR
jgi:hypothetical protein